MTLRAPVIIASLYFSGLALAQQQPQISLKTLPDQPLPLTVASGTVHSFGYTSEVLATLNTQQDVKIKSAEFYLVLYHGDKIIGGEGWTETSPGNIVRQTKLPLHDGDEAILLVDSVVTPTRTFSLTKTDVTENVMHMIRNEAFTVAPIQISMLPYLGTRIRTVQASGDFCSQALSAASSACTGAGLASFSCSLSQQNFSFTCKGGTGVPQNPGQPGH